MCHLIPEGLYKRKKHKEENETNKNNPEHHRTLPREGSSRKHRDGQLESCQGPATCEAAHVGFLGQLAQGHAYHFAGRKIEA